MPTAQSKPAHARWNDLPADTPIEGITRQVVRGDQAMVAQITLRKGAVVPAHSHVNEQIACVLSGALRFTLGGEDDADRREVVVRGGESLLLPSNVIHGVVTLEDTIVLDVFSPPADQMGIDMAD